MKHGKNLRKVEGVGWDLCLARQIAPANTICAKNIYRLRTIEEFLNGSSCQCVWDWRLSLNHDTPIFIQILTHTPEFVVPPLCPVSSKPHNCPYAYHEDRWESGLFPVIPTLDTRRTGNT